MPSMNSMLEFIPSDVLEILSQQSKKVKKTNRPK